MADEEASSPTSLLAAQLAAALGEGYDVVRPLGEGGFAVVFLVRDRSLKRDLAVKVLSPELITSKSMLERFQREAETIAQLSHPNIVPLHFIGQKHDLLYLAMQCVSGGSIADRMEREGKLPVADVVRIVTEVASALAHAHKRGVIHRDIKPPNVLVDAESGRCLVTDFGIARSSGAANLTATGVMLGTPAYLSPEQVTGEPLDSRVDVYALGVMAYELLAGRVPFSAPTPTATMMKRLAGPPDPVTTVRADVPAHVADAITACLASDPAMRLQTADDVIRAFNSEGATRSASARQDHFRVRLVRGGAVLVVVVAAAAAAYGVLRGLSRDSGASARDLPQAVLAKPVKAIDATESDMIVISAGDYPIGDDAGPSNVRPRHVERLAPFRIGRTEVPVGEYAKFVSATHAPSPWGTNGEAPDARLPVTGVSFGDAQNFCAWRYRDGGSSANRIRMGGLRAWVRGSRLSRRNHAGSGGGEYRLGASRRAGTRGELSARRHARGAAGHERQCLGMDQLRVEGVSRWRAATRLAHRVSSDSRRRLRFERHGGDGLVARICEG